MEIIRHEFQQRQHMLLEDYEIYHYIDECEPHVSLHFHDFYECYLLLSGSLSYQIESASFAVQPGDLLLISPNQLHRPLFNNSDRSYERIVLWLSCEFVERLSSSITDLSACFSAKRYSVIRLKDAERSQIALALFELIAADGSKEYGRDVLCLSRAVNLLVLINRISNAELQPLPKTAIRVSSLIKRVSAYLDSHISEEVTLDDVCNTVFLSKYYLERRFKMETGVSIYQMLQQKRMIMARNLIKEGLPFTVVAQKCGFSEYSGFYKAFRNEYGVSPRGYAADHQRL